MNARDIQRVLVVGAGIMGSGIAAEYAASGRAVTVFARTPESAARGKARAVAALETLARGGLTRGEPASIQELISAAHDIASAARDVELVVESVPEDLVLKRQVFAELEAICAPETIFASNTSGLPITEIGRDLTAPQRLVGTHYLNPPHLMPPVEVIPGDATSRDTVDTIVRVLTGMGKAPVVVRREVPGFLWNRIQFALAREAFWLVEHGVATMEEVDLVVRQGLGRRWAIAGPFASLDLGGIDTMAKVASYLFPELSDETGVPALLQERIAAGRFGAKTNGGFYDWPPAKLDALLARRDAALLAALRADRQEELLAGATNGAPT